MKFLFVTPVIPGPAYGRRPYNFIKALASRHEVHLLAVSDRNPSEKQLVQLRHFGVETIHIVPHPRWKGVLAATTALHSRWPLRVAYSKSRLLEGTLDAILKNTPVDLVHIDRLRLGYLAKRVVGSVRCVVDFTDSLSLYFSRRQTFTSNLLGKIVCSWEKKTIPNFEGQLAPDIDACLLCSSVDAEFVHRTVPEDKVRVIPNMVDSKTFAPKKREGNSKLIFTGTMTYFPNRDSLFLFAKEILPRIRKHVPEVETLVIGARPDGKVEALHGYNGIKVVGEVQNMADHLFANDIFVCPLRIGAGVRNKLLEAMASGMASVSTPLGAEGIAVKHGQHALLAEPEDQFAAAVVQLLRDDSLRAAIGNKAREFILQRHCGKVVGREIEQLYTSLVAA